MPELTDATIAERASWFEELGFADTAASLLAIARDSTGQLVTAHDVRQALERGCDHATALAIFS